MYCFLIIYSMFGYFDTAQKVIDQDNFGNEVWLSGQKYAESNQNVLSEKFSLVISCMDTEYRYDVAGVHHLRFPIDDAHDFDIKAYFEPSFEAIELGRKTGKVLVYSGLGISRSSTIIVAYLMQRYGKKWKECLEEIKNRRPCAQPK